MKTQVQVVPLRSFAEAAFSADSVKRVKMSDSEKVLETLYISRARWGGKEGERGRLG